MTRSPPRSDCCATVQSGSAARSSSWAKPVTAGARTRLGRVLREAQLSNIVIYSVGLSTTAAGLRAPASQAGPPQATPPGTFGGPPIPGTAQTPTSQQQYGGNIDLLGLAEWAVRNATAVVKDRPLEVAATATGGTYQSAFRDSKIENAVDAIGGELNSQYMLSYRPTGSDNPGYHTDQSDRGSPGSESPDAAGILPRSEVIFGRFQ